jgi:hypothetical protein
MAAAVTAATSTAAPSTPGRRSAQVLIAALLLPVLSGLFLALGSGTAHAATGYKYWNYFHVENGKYVFAKTGPSGFVPKNGSVEAYRYGLSSTANGITPRTGATTYSFDDICAGSKAQTGQKRVGVLLDYGTAKDAASGEKPPKPRAACAVVASNANGQQVLDAVTDVRTEKTLICGIDGYPVKSCSVTVKNAPEATTEQHVAFAMPAASKSSSSSTKPVKGDSEQGGGISWPLVAVIVVVIALVVGGVLLARRNRST